MIVDVEPKSEIVSCLHNVLEKKSRHESRHNISGGDTYFLRVLHPHPEIKVTKTAFSYPDNPI